MPEAYRHKFRSIKPNHNQTYLEFSREKESLFNQWLTSVHCESDYEKLRQAILLEEFKRCMSNDIQTYLEENNVQTLYDAASLADNYALTHKPKNSF